MEFVFASDRTNNAYFDRIMQTGVETSVLEITYCLEKCQILQRSYLTPDLTFPQKVCLRMNELI